MNNFLMRYLTNLGYFIQEFALLDTRPNFPGTRVVKRVINYPGTRIFDTRHWKHY